MGNRMKDIYPHATRWQVFKYRVIMFFRKVAICSFALGIIYGSFKVGAVTVPPKTVYADREVRVEVPVEPATPVLDRIAKCESGGKHKKNGQVIFNANTNKTVDVGIMQINSVWFAKAASLNFDLSIEKDNIEFAKWLYRNYGTEPWYSSKACWSK